MIPHPYDPRDPDRVCVSCGAAPSGSYSDGSPSYGCGPHPPLVASPEEAERILGLMAQAVPNEWRRRPARRRKAQPLRPIQGTER